MAETTPADEHANYETFRDCLSEPVLKALAAPGEKPKSKKKRHTKKSSKDKNSTVTNREAQVEVKVISSRETRQSDAEELGEFIEVSTNVQHSNMMLTILSTSAASYSPAFPSNFAPSRTPNSATPSPSKTHTPRPSAHQHTAAFSTSSPQTLSTASNRMASSPFPAIPSPCATSSYPS